MKRIICVAVMIIGLLNISVIQQPHQAIDKAQSITHIKKSVTDPGSG